MAHYLPTRSRHKESPTQKKSITFRTSYKLSLLGQFKYDKNINNCNNNKINKLIMRLILFCDTKRSETKYMGVGEKMLIINLNTV